MNLISAITLLGTAGYADAQASIYKPDMNEKFYMVNSNAEKLTELVDSAWSFVYNEDVDSAWNFMFNEEADDFSIEKKKVILNKIYNDLSVRGVHPEADDAILQLKTARLIMKMKDAYSGRENGPAASSDGASLAEENEFSEGGETGTLKSSFVNAKSNEAKLLDLMTEVETRLSNNDADGAYDFMFHTSGNVERADKIAKLNNLFETVKSQGVDVLAMDASLQIQSTICLLEMMRGFERVDAAGLEPGSLDSFLEAEDWVGAKKFIENPASFSEAVDFLPGAVGASIKKSLSEEDVHAAEEQLESIQDQMEERLSSFSAEDLSAEANQGEIEFSYDMVKLVEYIKRMVPSGVGEKKATNVEKLESLLEAKDWESAQEWIKNPSSLSEAVSFLPAATGASIEESLQEEDFNGVEKKLELMRNTIEDRLSSLEEKDSGEVQFSYGILDLLHYMQNEALIFQKEKAQPDSK